jgi:hypothetical protein
MGADGLAQQPYIPVLNVAPILPQVDRNAIGPGQFNQDSRSDGVRLNGTAGLAQGSNVVNINAEGRQGSVSLKSNH